MRVLAALAFISWAGLVQADCVSSAAVEYGIHPMVLQSVMTVEGGKLGYSKNTNGTYDLGPMQINSSWLPMLASSGVTAKALAYDACLNVRAGAWILKREIILAKGDVWKGIGNYHSHTPVHHNNYNQKVAAVLRRLTQNGNS